MATAKQVAFFDELLKDKEFPPAVNKEQLRQQFPSISDKSASAWIEKALALPKRDDSNDPFTDVPF